MFSSSCLFVSHNHVLCSWLLDKYSQTCRLARSPDPCAKTTGQIELQFGVWIGLGQCHFVLDGCPIPNRPSVTFPGEGHSWSLNILLPYISQTAQADAWSTQNRTLHGPAPSTSHCKRTITSKPTASTRVLDSKQYSSVFQYLSTRLIPLPVGKFSFRFQFSKLISNCYNSMQTWLLLLQVASCIAAYTRL